MRILEKLFIAIVMLVSLAVMQQQAQAADLPSNLHALTTMNEQGKPVNWSGPSAAVYLGWGTATSTLSVDDFASLSGIGNDGVVVGGELAYDARVAHKLLIGVFAGGDWSDINTKLSIGNSSLEYGYGSTLYTGARVGVIVGESESVLLYAKGLYAWNSPSDVELNGATVAKLHDRSGWGFGGGAEFVLVPNSKIFGFIDYTRISYDSECVYCSANGSIKESTDFDVVRFGTRYRW